MGFEVKETWHQISVPCLLAMERQSSYFAPLTQRKILIN